MNTNTPRPFLFVASACALACALVWARPASAEEPAPPAPPADSVVLEPLPPTEATADSASEKPAEPAHESAHESDCKNGVDEDGDTVVDCADADCKDDAACKADGQPENSSERCSDWIDNDNDGEMDCEDAECGRGIAVCQGSWVGPLEGDGGAVAGRGAIPGYGATAAGRGMAPEVEAADSNDGIGFVGVRFGVVAGVVQSLELNDNKDPGTYEAVVDTRVNLLQLRAFGALPLLEDSFFLINVRGDRSPRLTFAMFQVPIGAGHYVNVNTGGGTLSNALIISAAKQPLLEPAFYLTNAFEQGNGAAVEVHGPIIPGALRYRAILGGGAGFGSGNIGGRRFDYDNFNYTYTVGGQLQSTPIGSYSRFDSPFLYRPVPLALAVNAGAKYDQRQQERYPAVNVQTILRWGYFELYVEDYVKTELNFGAVQNAYNVTFGVLLWPEVMFGAVDFGQFWTSDFGELERATGGVIDVADPPDVLETELRRQRGETQARAALHWYFWRNNGILSARYAARLLDAPLVGPDKDRTQPFTTHEMWLATQFRF